MAPVLTAESRLRRSLGDSVSDTLSQLCRETLMFLLVMALLAQCCSRSLELLKVGQNSLGVWEGQVNESALNSWENHCNYRCRVPLPPGSALSLACATLPAQPRR